MSPLQQRTAGTRWGGPTSPTPRAPTKRPTRPARRCCGRGPLLPLRRRGGRGAGREAGPREGAAVQQTRPTAGCRASRLPPGPPPRHPDLAAVRPLPGKVPSCPPLPAPRRHLRGAEDGPPGASRRGCRGAPEGPFPPAASPHPLL